MRFRSRLGVTVPPVAPGKKLLARQQGSSAPDEFTSAQADAANHLPREHRRRADVAAPTAARCKPLYWDS